MLFLVGCAAAWVVATSDPQKKLNDARALLRLDRPLPAERLIQEAIAICKERGDSEVLGNAYMDYASFFVSEAVSSSYWEKYYRERRGGVFQDESVTYDNRFVKAKEYRIKALECYQRAEKLYRETAKFDKLIYVYFNTVTCYKSLDDRVKACNFLDRSLEAYSETMRRDPNAKPYYVTDGSTFPELIGDCKKRTSCK